MKMCSKCKIEYPATTEYFTKDKNRTDGLFSCCKKCKNEISKKSYHKNIEENHRKRKEWRDNNKEIKSAQDKLYREKLKNRKPEEVIMPKEKVCARCKRTKTFDNFFKNITAKDGLTGYCKKCTKIKNGKSYQKHRDKRKAQSKQYGEQNKDRIALVKKNYYKKHKRKIKKYKAMWQKKNQKRLSEKAKTYRLEHKEDRNNHDQSRKQKDINYRMVCNLRTRLSNAMKYFKKSNHTMKLVGCSINELKRYLESQFLQNMTWDNYGRGGNKWSIDHIRPCSSFNLLVSEQQKLCFHYSNMRPLWNIDNFKKNSLYNGKYIRKQYQKQN